MIGSVRVEIDDGIPPEVMKIIKQNQKQVGDMILSEAERSTAFSDKTGTLRNAGKVIEEGEVVKVRFKAPHAHLVEFGHGGPHPAPAHPFLRPAKESVIAKIK